jgi:hypothetical protein
VPECLSYLKDQFAATKKLTLDDCELLKLVTKAILINSDDYRQKDDTKSFIEAVLIAFDGDLAEPESA